MRAAWYTNIDLQLAASRAKEGAKGQFKLSNAEALLRLGCLSCVVSVVACAQGVSSPGTEGLTDDAGGSVSSAGAGTSNTAGSGDTGDVAGSPPIVAGGSTGSSGASSGSGAGATGGGSTGTAGGGTSSAAGSSGATQSTGGGTGAQGCSHPQPGAMGLVVQYKDNAADSSVPYIFFSIEIDNPDDNAVAISDLHFRYYFNNDLTTPVTEFYSPQTKDAQGSTHNLDGSALEATYTPTYLEVGFTTDAQLNTGESLMFQVHMHSDPDPGSHDQSTDYSYSPSTTLTPWCHVTVYQQTALAWGTPD
jgi:hypothetical protein